LHTWCIQNQIEKSEEKENGYTWEGNYFLEYLKASIADLITLLSSSVQNSEGGGDGDGDGGNSCADPFQEFKQDFLGVYSGLPLL
jgi:hypothetical protein